MILAEGLISESYAWIGLIPVALIVAALIFNVSSHGTRDLNIKAFSSANVLLVAMLIEAATLTVRSFGGGTVVGAFVVILVCVVLHVISAAIALGAVWEFRTIGRWPSGSRRALWGFWLNVIMLVILSGWFYLLSNDRLFNRIIR